MMDKLISQQAAIDAVAKWIFEVFGIKESDGTATVFKRLRELPSAQPETNCSEIPNNSDTISRQAVTKFLNDWLSCLFENCHKQSASDLKMIIKDFKNLPSAQPEQHLDEWCVDCKEYDKEKHFCPRWNRVIRQTLLDAQPEHKTGRWIPDDSELGIKCNKCGKSFSDYVNAGTEYIFLEEIPNFCPNCGAEMEGERKE